MRAVVDRHGASLQVAPDARARREAHRPRRGDVAFERPRDEDRVRLDRLARDAGALGDREVAAERHVPLDVALDDEVPVAVDAPADARGAADARIGGVAGTVSESVVRVCAMGSAREASTCAPACHHLAPSCRTLRSRRAPASPRSRRPWRTRPRLPAAAATESRAEPPLVLLLAPPFVGMLWVPFYNRVEPRAGSVPFFYWYQFVWIGVSAVLTAVVYFATRDADR